MPPPTTHTENYDDTSKLPTNPVSPYETEISEKSITNKLLNES